MGQTVGCFWFLCLTPAPPAPEHQIFGFGEFLGALVLLIVVFQIVDFRYRFRLAILPFHFRTTLLVLISFIGLGTLAMELWLAQGWPTLYTPIAPSVWQAIFALLFLGTFIALTYATFVDPPVFSRRNARRFTSALYQIVIKGNDAELTVVADELKRSTRYLVQLCATREEYEKRNETPGSFAYDVFGVIANRKFCRHIVGSAQSTAIFLCQDIREIERYDVPIGPFCKAVTEEAILNKDSILHHESEEFSLDLIGHVKPWSKTIYGDYQLIRNMGFDSPLKLNVWSLNKQWDIQHWTAYTRVIIAVLEGYSDTEHRDDGMALGSAIRDLHWLTVNLAREDNGANFFESERYLKLCLVTDFFEQAIKAIESASVPIIGTKKPLPGVKADIYDGLARLMYEILLAASRFQGSRDVMWNVQHNTAWMGLFERREEKRSLPLAIVQSRVVRRFYEQIKRMDEIGPIYPGLRVVGLVLNILGLKAPSRQNHLPCERAIYKFAEEWTTKNFLRLNDEYPGVAKALLIGSLDFDEETRRIRKSYASWLGKEGTREYLDLEEPLEQSEE